MNKETPATKEQEVKKYPRAQKFAKLIKKGRNGTVKFQAYRNHMYDFFPPCIFDASPEVNRCHVSVFNGNETKEDVFPEADILEIARERCSEVRG